jgi:FixJ family two-component response regulator
MTAESDQIALIVDDDARICAVLENLLASRGLRSLAFPSIAAYMQFRRPDLPACLILDVQLPDISGLEFQGQADDLHPPIVFITGHSDIPSSVLAIKRGAINFLTKPFSETELMDSIQAGIDRDRIRRRERAQMSALTTRYRSLTSREREVLPLIVAGLLNKQAAGELGISEVTLQIHRGKIMQKMEAASLADLVRLAERLQIPITHRRRKREQAQ